MTEHFKNMLYLFGANAQGIDAHIDGELNIEKIRKLAIEQGIWTLVYPELSKLCDAKKYHMEFFSMVSKGIAKKEFTLKILKKLEEAGVSCCLLKGASVSELYNDSECRISGDTDILINPEDEEKLKKVLLESGYVVEDRSKNDHHLKAYHKTGGLLEAHVRLYSETTEKILFNGLNMYGEAWVKRDINGAEYNVLGINDGLMYLTAHYIKHLVNEGGGVRQMMDLLLYIEANRDKIDFEKYEKYLSLLKYDKLIDVVKTIGAKYFGFDYEIKHGDLAEKILTDSEKGGIFGFEADDRANFYEQYCKNRTTMSKAKYKVFMSLKGERTIFDKIFPSQKMMVHVYGYKFAQKAILLPVAWVWRLLRIILKKDNKKSAQEGNGARIKLMRDLGMI